MLSKVCEGYFFLGAAAGAGVAAGAGELFVSV